LIWRWLLVAAVLLAARTAVAAPSADDQEEARKHYERGMSRYALGEFDAAVTEFKEAYARTEAPGLLFNLAQASRLAKQYEQALHFYRSYLRARPRAANRRDVESFILQLEPLVNKAPAPAPAPATATPATTPSSEPSTAGAPEPGSTTAPSLRTPASKPPGAAPSAAPVLVPPPPRHAPTAADRGLGRTWLIAGLVTLGVGVGALATGVAFGLSSQSASNDIAHISATGGSWTPDAQQRFDDGRRDATIATALYAVGGAGVAAGVVVTVLGARKRAAAPRWSLAPLPGGAAASWSCSF
jgi:tetratricopeptide (TPR) repeat protein